MDKNPPLTEKNLPGRTKNLNRSMPLLKINAIASITTPLHTTSALVRYAG
jgi:hypothetical protein